MLSQEQIIQKKSKAFMTGFLMNLFKAIPEILEKFQQQVIGKTGIFVTEIFRYNT